MMKNQHSASQSYNIEVDSVGSRGHGPAAARKLDFKFITKHFALKYWKLYAGGIVTLGITNYISFTIPVLAKKIVDALESQPGEIGSLIYWAQAIIALGLFQILIRSLSRIMIFWPGRNIEANLKNTIFDRILFLPYTFIHKVSIGDLVSRITNDSNQIRVLYAFAFLNIINFIFAIIYSGFHMTAIHPGLAAASIAPLFLSLIMVKLTTPVMYKYSALNQKYLGNLSAACTETFKNINVIKLANAEKRFENEISDENDKVYETNIKLLLIRNFIFPLMVCLTGFSEVIILFYGGSLVIDGKITIGSILAMNVYISYLTWPLSSLGFVINIYQRSKAALERINIVMTEEEQPYRITALDSVSTAAAPAPIWEIRALTYQHPSTSPIKEIPNAGNADNAGASSTAQTSKEFKLNIDSLQINPGEKIGIFGPIGSGKTTLFSLLTRLLDPSPGQIRFMGKDILEYSPSSIRSRIQLVPQNINLFSFSLYENIDVNSIMHSHSNNLENLKDSYEKPTVKFREAISIASLDEDVGRFPEKENTLLGENGVKVSGGQKQRIALARSLHLLPDVLLLDDCLSAVDQKTEAKILLDLFKSINTIVYATNRTAPLRYCDKIFAYHEEKGASYWKLLDQREFEEFLQLQKANSNSQTEQ